uniref:Uncharacterized protein n=1 Tax=Oryza meridionalis TaxID=40149 RepID=A0A0E0EQH5_9ORYZ
MEVSRSGPYPNLPLCQEATDSPLRWGDAEREREKPDPETPCRHCTREMLRGKGMRKATTTRPRRLAEAGGGEADAACGGGGGEEWWWGRWEWGSGSNYGGGGDGGGGGVGNRR